jgi:hypothetical protein
MAVTTNQGLILPDGTDNANVPLTFTDFVTTAVSGMENRLVQRYLSIADRTTRNPAPNEGELSYLADLNRYETFNGVAWVTAFTLNIDEQVFTASGTWIKPANAQWVFVEVLGAGGAGGGVTGNPTGSGAGGGGGSGGYVRRMWVGSALGASEAVVVGTGGAGVSAGTGNTGVSSTFNVMVGSGGTGGSAMTSTVGSSIATGGNGGAAAGGTVNIPGSSGDSAMTLTGVNIPMGRGGGSYFGGQSRITASIGTGNAALVYGCGGSGALGSTVNQAGGAGFAGLVIVTTYS